MAVQLITLEDQDQVIHAVQEAVDWAFTDGIVDQEGVERLLGNTGELQAYIIAGLRKFSASPLYADEQDKSEREYPFDYKLKDIEEQVEILRQMFLGLGSFDENVLMRPLPQYAEGWFAIPRWDKVAGTYHEAIAKVLKIIANTRDCEFFDYDFLDLYQSARTEVMYKKLADQQKGHDILMVPAQFGLYYRGHSVRRAQELFLKNEFGLGLFGGLCMLLTHPERIQSSDDLGPDFPGDQFPPLPGNDLESTLAAFFYEEKLDLTDPLVNSYCEEFGSASGFLPPGA